MIEIIVNNITLLLDPKTKIRVEWNSPLFAEDVIEGNKVYWFDVPLNATNNKAFKHSNILGVSGKYQTYTNTTLRLLEIFELKGTLIVSNITTKYRVSFTTNDLSQYKETLLTDMDWGNSVNIGSTTQDVIDHADAKVLQSYPETNYNFPMIYNPDFYNGENITFEGFVNFWSFVNKGFIANKIWDGTISNPELYPFNVDNAYNITPQFYLPWMLSRLATILGLTFTGELLTDSDLQQIMVYNDYALDKNDNEYYVKAEDGDRDIVDTDVLKFTTIDKGNNVTYDGKEFTIDYTGFHSFYLRVRCTTSTPGTVELKISIYNKTTSTELANEIIAAGSTTSEEILFIYHDEKFSSSDAGDVIQMKITANTSWVIAEMECSITNLSQTNLNRYAKLINPSNHVPKMKLNDFLKDLRMMLGSVYFIDNISNSLQMSFLKDIMNSAYIDLTNKIAIGQKINILEKKNFSLDFEWDESDDTTKDNFLNTGDFTDQGTYPLIKNAPQPVDPKEIIKSKITNQIHKTGYTPELLEKRWLFYTDIKQKQEIDNSADETKEIKIKANPALMYSWPLIYYQEMLDEQFAIFPQIKKKGNSIIYGTKEEDSEDRLKLMNWFGIVTFNDKFGFEQKYPFASSFNYDMNDVKQKNITLFLEGADGLYNNYLKSWYDFISNTEEATFKSGVNFGIADLMKLIQVICQPQNGATTSNIRWIMIESIKYLPKQITAEISMQGLESVEVKTIKQAF